MWPVRREVAGSTPRLSKSCSARLGGNMPDELVQQAGFATLRVMGILDMLNLALLALLVCNYGGAQIIEMNSWTRCHISPAMRRSTVKPPKVGLPGKSSPKKYSCL